MSTSQQTSSPPEAPTQTGLEHSHQDTPAASDLVTHQSEQPPEQQPEQQPDVAGNQGEEDDLPEFTDDAFSDIASTTASLTSSIFNHRYQHGRRFNAYKPDTYFMPNDNEEQQRMDIQYNALTFTFDEKLHFSPLEDPKRILDCGTGTGFWTMEMGDAYPEAEKIIGIDLSPIQDTWTPPNVQFQIDDIEE